MGTFSSRRRVEFRDTDAAGLAHFTAFLFWMESVEHELLRAAGVPVWERQADGSEVSWPRVSVSCDYRSPVRFGDEIDVSASVARVGRTSVTYEFDFSHDRRHVAAGRVVAVRCRMRAGHPPEATPIPDDVVRRLAVPPAGS